MVPKVEQQIKSDSLLNNGTWAFLGSSTNKSNRYLFWTSVDTDAVRCGKADTGHYQLGERRLYISETITATRVNSGKKYVAITDHIKQLQQL